MAYKNGTQNGPFINEHKDQNLRSPDSVILSHPRINFTSVSKTSHSARSTSHLSQEVARSICEDSRGALYEPRFATILSPGVLFHPQPLETMDLIIYSMFHVLKENSGYCFWNPNECVLFVELPFSAVLKENQKKNRGHAEGPTLTNQRRLP